MQHFTEHTIELYVLGAETGDSRWRDVEAHLKECHGCRQLAEEIRAFYLKADAGFTGSAHPANKSGRALSPVPRRMVPFTDETLVPGFYRPATPGEWFRWAVRQHPVMTAAGGIGTLAVCAMLALLILRNDLRAPEPAYAHLDPERATIDIYNLENRVLWNIPCNSIYHIGPETYNLLASRVIVTDMNGDGHHEVITSLPVGDGESTWNPATIFRSDGSIRTTISLNEKVRYAGTEYASIVSVRDLACDKFSSSASKEIIITSDNGRSPNLISRFSADGMKLGEYFHFGDVRTAAVDLPGFPYRHLAVFGQNDTGDPDSLSYGVLIILDPSRLTGSAQAGESPGFGLPYTHAEREIVRFPQSDMDAVLHAQSHVGNIHTIMFDDKPAISVFVHGSVSPVTDVPGTLPIFEYILSPDMKVLAVKYDSATLIFRNELVRRGKLTGTFDAAYLEDLKNRVRYWNGHSWQGQPVWPASLH
jgi:hypothetical protein